MDKNLIKLKLIKANKTYDGCIINTTKTHYIISLGRIGRFNYVIKDENKKKYIGEMIWKKYLQMI